MFKKQLKTILLATVATLSISSMVSARPIPEDTTGDMLLKGLRSKLYTPDDIEYALNKKQPNVMGYMAFSGVLKFIDKKLSTETIEYAYSLAQQASAKGDILGQFSEGYFLAKGQEHISSLRNLSEEKRKNNAILGATQMLIACKGNKSKPYDNRLTQLCGN